MPMVVAAFDSKWRGCGLVPREEFLEFMAETEVREELGGKPRAEGRLDIGEWEVDAAFVHIKKQNILGADGSCMEVWAALHASHPGLLAELMEDMVANPEEMESVVVAARLLGKGTRYPKVSEVRAILPLSPLPGRPRLPVAMGRQTTSYIANRPTLSRL